MTAVAILTPDPTDASFAGLWELVLQRLEATLAAVGITVVPVPWTSQVEDCTGLARFPLVLPLLAWGYHYDHERWLRACASWEQAHLPIANPARVLAWNSDKRYLAALAEQGVAIAPTTWTDRLSAAQLETMFSTTGAQQLILKPTVSGGAWKTLRIGRGERLDDLVGDAPDDRPGGPVMIQPYLSTIETEGETSMLFFGGRLSHVVNKRPVAGEFRVQVQYGGIYTSLQTPPAGALALAEQTLAAIGTPLLYARIDTVPDEDGRWLLMEAELIEPDFYLGADPAQGAGFASAVMRRLQQATA